MEKKPTKRKPQMLENEALVKAAGYKIVYHPYGAALDVFTMRDEEILMAGPAGTGKSRALLEKVHLVLSKYAGSRFFMSRKTRESMGQSCMFTFEKLVLKPQDKVHHHKQDQCYYYPNGSVLATVGLDNPEKIKSTEWDGGYIQEATEVLEHDWEMCTSRLRAGVVPFQQLLADCNPDRPTHWLKRRCDTGKTKMLHSKHEDNPQYYNHKTGLWTAKGVTYRGKLDRLTGVRRSRLFLGLWVAAEGLVYEQWNPEVQRVTRAQLPSGWESWPHYWVIDFGFKHPFCWQDWIEDPETGKLYRLHEVYHTKILVEDHAKFIKEHVNGRYVPRAVICDHDAEGRATFERHSGFLTIAAYKTISAGVEAVQKRFSPNWNDSGGPGMYFVHDALLHKPDPDLVDESSPTCTEEELEGYVWDVKNNEKANSRKDEIPIDKDNHGCDDVRYLAAFIDGLAIDPQDVEEEVALNEDSETISIY